jgi:3-methyladenine DNA glycosylase AlkC
MSSILALSATHLAWLTNSVETWNLAYYHRSVANNGTKRAIGNFSNENSDAILAASILLSWQSSDW